MLPSQDETVIAIDAMGGDLGTSVNIRGAIDALAESSHLKVVLVGDRSILTKEASKLGIREGQEPFEIVHCDEVISMEDHAASVIRKKKNSSIHVGMELVRDQKAHAFISSGNSGAIMAGSLLIIGRISDVERPAIIVRLPTAEGFITLLDVGANVDCKPIHLCQFAEMGRVYAETVEGIANPRIALLSNGSEAHKGNELTREADALLRKQSDLNYIGYVEGFDLFRGSCDVIVCDGFVGNVALKVSEGLADSVFSWFRKEIKNDIAGIVGVLLLRKLLKKFRRKFDYQPYGAAPLLGVNGLVLISHGSSTEVAIRNAILTAKKAVDQNLIAKMKNNLNRTSQGHNLANKKDEEKK